MCFHLCTAAGINTETPGNFCVSVHLNTVKGDLKKLYHVKLIEMMSETSEVTGGDGHRGDGYLQSWLRGYSKVKDP